MIKNPIIRKEVLSALRTKKAVAMQGLMFAVMAGLLWPVSYTHLTLPTILRV